MDRSLTNPTPPAIRNITELPHLSITESNQPDPASNPQPDDYGGAVYRESNQPDPASNPQREAAAATELNGV